MARLKLSALVSSMEGSLNGSSIHTGKGGVFLRNKSYPKQSNSKARINSVNQFSSLVQAWSSLTATQKNAWNDFTRKYAEKTKNGDTYNPGGYAHFLAVNRLRASAELPTLTDPGTYTGEPYSLNFSVSEFFIRINPTENIIQSLVLDVNLSGNTTNACSFVLSISQPLGKTSSRNFGTMYPIGFFRIPAGYQNQGTFSVLLPEINPNPLILLQSGRQYAIEITPMTENSAIYTTTLKATATTETSGGILPQALNQSLQTFTSIRPRFESLVFTQFTGYINRSPQTVTVAGLNIETWVQNLSPEGISDDYNASYYYGNVTFPATAITQATPRWLPANAPIAAGLISNLPVNFQDIALANTWNVAFRFTDPIGGEKYRWLLGRALIFKF